MSASADNELIIFDTLVRAVVGWDAGVHGGLCVGVIDLLSDMADLHGSGIAVDAPTMPQHAVYAVGIRGDIVDVEHKNRIIYIDIDVIGIIGRSREEVSVYIGDKAHASFLLEIDFAQSVLLGIDDGGIEEIALGIAANGDTEDIVIAGCGECE